MKSIMYAILAMLIASCEQKEETFTTPNGKKIPLSAFERISKSKFGGCFKCGESWRVVTSHSTPYDDRRDTLEDGTIWGPTGMFVLCETCWSSLTPDTRLPYYRELVDEWVYQEDLFGDEKNAEDKWPLIKAAVEAGK